MLLNVLRNTLPPLCSLVLQSPPTMLSLNLNCKDSDGIADNDLTGCEEQRWLPAGAQSNWKTGDKAIRRGGEEAGETPERGTIAALVALAVLVGGEGKLVGALATLAQR